MLTPEASTALRQWLEQWSRCGITFVNRPNPESMEAISSVALGRVADPIQSTEGGVALTKPVSEVPVLSSFPTTVQGSNPPVSTSKAARDVANETSAVASHFDGRPVGTVAKDLGKGISVASNWDLPNLQAAERVEALGKLSAEVQKCRRCTELACTRKQTVFGVGNPMPRIVFFGEAPGADEDRVGEPFVGKAGQLLNKIISASKLKREDVYILNSLKCRPPDNRTPLEQEIESCRPFFEQQLSILQPEYIVCLGSVAVRALLRSTESVGRLRGKFHLYKQAKVLVTYHPAYLLRNESAKKLTWEDMQLLMKALGIPLP